MYTSSVESEQAFYLSLARSHELKMADGETVVAGVCPNCSKGNALIRCTWQKDERGLIQKGYDYYCDACGEKFNLNKIATDIFYHKPFKMLDKLEMPFGDIHVRINDVDVPFRYDTSTYDYYEDTHGKPVLVHNIYIDMSDLKPGDVVFCGFDSSILHYNDSGERFILHSYESDTQILGLGALDPDVEEWYCYWLDACDSNGFYYKVTADPGNFAEWDYWSWVTSLSMAVLNMADYEDADMTLYMALH